MSQADVTKERANFMGELESIRDEIRTDLSTERTERREDLQKLERKLDKLTVNFQDLRLDVVRHKTQIGLIGSFFGLTAGALSAWIVTHLGGGSS